jgi:hypothetical protein
MFGSGVLEIAIGMLFIYLLLSTISSAVNLLKQLVNVRLTGVPPDERPKPRSDEGSRPQS